jgi:hypothetical protein
MSITIQGGRVDYLSRGQILNTSAINKAGKVLEIASHGLCLRASHYLGVVACGQNMAE